MEDIHPAIVLEMALQRVWVGRTLDKLTSESGWPTGERAVLALPTYLQDPTCPANSPRTWPVYWNPEPGTLVAPGKPVACRWTVDTDQVHGEGTCLVIVGPPPARMPKVDPPRWTRAGSRKSAQPPAWLSAQAPSMIALSPIPPGMIQRHVKRQVAAGVQAREAILRMYYPMLLTQVQRLVPRMGVAVQGADQQDLIQRGYMTISTMVDQFASNDRPHASWVAVLRQNLYRDLTRATARWADESISLAQARAWLWNHPEVRSLAQARAEGISDRLTDATIEEALHRPQGAISLHPLHELAPDHPEDEASYRHQQAVVGYDDPWLETDPQIIRNLRNTLAQLGIQWEAAQPWLYKIGVFDRPHTRSEVVKAFGVYNYRKSAIVETKFFSNFAGPGEDWDNPLDRPSIRERAMQILCQDGSLRQRAQL